MKLVQIDIKNKIAELSAPALIICGNSDYVVEFNLDEEWAEHPVRTARFSTWNGYTDVVFEGTQCPVPVLSQASYVKVGVFAGDLCTTTPAYVPCKKSILCEGGAPIEPTPDVYAQLVAMIEAGMVKGDKGEKGDKGDQGDQGEKGEKGDAGAVKFEIVVELPSDNIKTDIIYLLPNDSGAENNVFTGYVYVDGKWKPLGAISIQGNLSEYAKFTDYAELARAGVVKRSGNGVGGVEISTKQNEQGTIMVYRAINETIHNRVPNDYRDRGTMDENRCQPICPANLDYAFKEVLVNPKSKDSNGNDLVGWDDVDRKLARDFLGITNSSSGEPSKLMIYETYTANTNEFTPINNAEVIDVEKGHLIWGSSTTNVLFEIAFYDGSSIQTQTIEIPPLKNAIGIYSQMFLLGTNRLIFELEVLVEGDSGSPSVFMVTIKEQDDVGDLSFVVNKIYVETN